MFVVTLICVVSAVYWAWRRKNTKTTEPPLCPGAWPILGHVLHLIGDTRKLWDKINEIAKLSYDMGGVVSARIGLRTVYVITDPEDNFTIANTCFEKDAFYDFAEQWLGEGLVTAKYTTWANHRRLLNPAFSQKVLDTFIGVFNSQSRKLVMDLEKEAGKGYFDHWTYTRHNALETICLTALGVDFTDSSFNSDFVEAMDQLVDTLAERFLNFWWHSPYIFAWSNVKKKQDACLKILHSLSYAVLQKRKTELQRNICAVRSILPGKKFKPFLDLLLELSAEQGVFNDRQIREHVDTMIVGGHDTSANVIMYTMVLLGSHPKVQEKVYEEIQDVLGGDRDVEKSDLSKMVYLEAVLKETMRVFTIVPVVCRKLHKDIKLKNYTLTAGRSCFLFLFGIHKHPIWGPDAHEFKPERWLEPGRLPDNPNAFAAFSVGRRQCIGKVYALMSMKTTLAHLVRRYRIKADHTKVRLKVDFMLKPDTGHHVSIEKRT